MSIGLLILGLVLFILLVVVHEAGHFIVARRNGVEVEEFGIFFPPRLWSHRTKGGWEFSINLIPLGGFVRLKGEHDADTGKGTYGAARLSSKVKIMLAGVAMNLLAAFVLLTILAWVGIPQLINNQFTVNGDTKNIKNNVLVGYVQPGSPAAKAGLQSSDELIQIGSQKVTSADTLPNITKQFAGQRVPVTYIRQGQEHTVAIGLLSASVVTASQQKYKNEVRAASNNCSSIPDAKGYLGISPTAYIVQRSTWSAPIVAVGTIGQFTGLTFSGLGHALGGVGSTIAGLVTGNTAARQNGQCQADAQVTGPVGIFEILKSGTLLGYEFVLMIIAVISLSLAIMNVLPIPALDGGKLFVTLVARALKKKLTEKAEAIIYGTGFVVLMGLVILITIVDVRRNF